MLDFLAELILNLLFCRWVEEGDDIPWGTILVVLLLIIGVAALIAKLCGVW